MKIFYLDLGHKESPALLTFLKQKGETVYIVKETDFSSKVSQLIKKTDIIDLIIVSGVNFHNNFVEKCKMLRSLTSLPIVCLIQNSSPLGASKLLNTGVDDCLRGEIILEEFYLRLQKITKRNRKLLYKNKLFKVGCITANLSEKQIEINKRQIMLTKTEYRIFLYLLLRARILVKKDELEFHAFPQYSSNSHALNMHISRIRKKIQPEVDIKAMSTSGFMLTLNK